MRIIAHLDMDAFFASVEERDRPYLAGFPIVIGADPAGGGGRGVVSTANYKAREYGIHSAMPIGEAWRLSRKAKAEGKAEAIFLSPDFSKYEKINKIFNSIIAEFSTVIEPGGIDETYFDLSAAGSFDRAREIALEIKKRLKEREQLTCSIGLGPNKLVAKMASDFKKPDGLTVVSTSESEKFLENFALRKIPGIGPKAERTFLSLRIKSVKEAKKLSQNELKEILGKWGGELYYKLRGVDESPLVTEWTAKSVGEQETFETDTIETKILLSALSLIVKRVLIRFSDSGFKHFRTIVLSVRFADFETKSRSRTFAPQTALSPAVYEKALALLLPFLDKRENPEDKKIRMLGFRLEKFSR
jgi:nucleotidyltransferase/DNA polymerase involved in DNA repair